MTESRPEKPYDMEERLVNFAADMAFFCRDLPKDFAGQYYGNQLLRSSGSSALNFGEMQGAQSDKDFKNKAAISLKELKESRMNIKILAKMHYGDSATKERLLDETDKFIKIVATIIKNKR